MNKLILAVTISLVTFGTTISAQNLLIDIFSINANGGAVVMSVNKDGKVIVNGQRIGFLQKNGKLQDPSGRVIAVIDASGEMSAGGKPLGTVNKNGAYDNGVGKKVDWSKSGVFKVDGSDFLTILPNDERYYRTATFLIALHLFANQGKIDFPAVTPTDEQLKAKFKYRDSDLVASIQRTPCLGNCPSYSIRIFGDGRITRAGETLGAKKVPSNKEEIQLKIKRLLQRAEELNFQAIYEKIAEKPAPPFAHDGVTTSIGVVINGSYRQVNCAGDGFCNQELRELQEYFLLLFADEIGGNGKSGI